MIELLKQIEKEDLRKLLSNLSLWQTLDVDYYPPRVERLWLQYDDNHRLFIHKIHHTDAPCLYHKHRWEAAFKILKGEYEMGITYCENEISSEEAYKLKDISRFIIAKGSYYEMRNTHTLHYVKPLGDYSISLMLTGNLYPEERHEILDKKLQPLSKLRKLQIAKEVLDLLDK